MGRRSVFVLIVFLLLLAGAEFSPVWAAERPFYDRVLRALPEPVQRLIPKSWFWRNPEGAAPPRSAPSPVAAAEPGPAAVSSPPPTGASPLASPTPRIAKPSTRPSSLPSSGPTIAALDPNKSLVWVRWSADPRTFRFLVETMKKQLAPTRTTLDDGSPGVIQTEILHAAHYKGTYLVLTRRKQPGQLDLIWAYQVDEKTRQVQRVGTDEWTDWSYRGLVRFERNVSQDVVFIHYPQGLMTAPYLSSIYFHTPTRKWLVRRWSVLENKSILLQRLTPSSKTVATDALVNDALYGEPMECRYRIAAYFKTTPNQLALLCRHRGRFVFANFVCFVNGQLKVYRVPAEQQATLFENLRHIPNDLRLNPPASPADLIE